MHTPNSYHSENPDAAFLNAARENVAYYNFPKAELDAILTNKTLLPVDKLIVLHTMCLTYRTANLSSKTHLKAIAGALHISRDTLHRRMPKLVHDGYLAHSTQGINETEIQYRASAAVITALGQATVRSTRIEKSKKTSALRCTPEPVHPSPLPSPTVSAPLISEALVMPVHAVGDPTPPTIPAASAPIAPPVPVKRTPPTPEALASQIANVTVETVGPFTALNVDPTTIPLILETDAVPYYLGATTLSDVVFVHGYDNMRAKLPLREVLGRAYALRYRYQAAEIYHRVSLAAQHGTQRCFARMDAISDYVRGGYSQADLNLALLCKTWLKEAQAIVDLERTNKEKLARERQRQETYIQQKALIEAEKAALAAQAAAGETGALLPFGKDLVALVQTTLQQQLEQGDIHPSITQNKSLATLATEILSYLNSQSAVTRETRWSKCLYLCRIGGWKTPTYLLTNKVSTSQEKQDTEHRVHLKPTG
ncbi:MAG: hypothetical protein V4490_05755 [Pseudomonadota bacterium]